MRKKRAERQQQSENIVENVEGKLVRENAAGVAATAAAKLKRTS